MSIKVFLDDVEVTAAMNAQHPLPSTISAGVFPDASHEKWWDLWGIIKSTTALKDNFQKKAVHTMKVVDSAGTEYDVKLLTKAKYTARNR